jgi:hypothetical protein
MPHYHRFATVIGRHKVGIILGYGGPGMRPQAAPIPIMAEAHELKSAAPDARAVSILAKNIYREVRAGGFSERDVMALAGELLTLVTNDVKGEAARAQDG